MKLVTVTLLRVIPFGLALTTGYAAEPWHYRYWGRELAPARQRDALMPPNMPTTSASTRIAIAGMRLTTSSARTAITTMPVTAARTTESAPRASHTTDSARRAAPPKK